MSETIEQKCLSKGVKLTDQRRIIAQVMSKSTDHPDVDELYKRVSKIDSKISIFDSIVADGSHIENVKKSEKCQFLLGERSHLKL